MSHGSTGNPMKKLFDGIVKNCRSPERDFAWEDVISFYNIFSKGFGDEETETAFRKKYNPDGNPNIPSDKAVQAMLELVRKPEFCLTLQTDAKVLDKKTHGTVHHAVDFRYMIQQLGDDLSESDYDDFIREALGRGDDTFDINEFISFMCKH